MLMGAGNCEGMFIVQQPPCAQNHSVGHIGLHAVRRRRLRDSGGPRQRALRIPHRLPAGRGRPPAGLPPGGGNMGAPVVPAYGLVGGPTNPS